MPTIAYLKSLIKNTVSPTSDEEFLRLVQEADIRLLEFGKWRWTRSKLTLTPASGIITLPATHVAILGAQVNGSAVNIFAEEHEFVPDGIGEIEVGGANGVMLIDQGLDGDGLRAYKVTGVLPADVSLQVLATKAPALLYDPDIADSSVPEDAVDTTVCPDVAALKLACLGIIMEEANDMKQSREFFSTALATLDNKEKAARGNARQTVNIRSAGPGIRKIFNPR